MSRLKKSSHRRTPDRSAIHLYLRDSPVFPGVRVQTDRGTIRDKKELAELRHGNEIVIHIARMISGKPDHTVVGMFIDLPATVGIEHKRSVIKTAHIQAILTLGQSSSQTAN